MTPAESWIRERLAGAPERLLETMIAALPSGPMPADEAMARAALALYAQVAARDGGRATALPLLAADALMTHALEAHAEVNPGAVAGFAAEWGAARRLGELTGDRS